MSDHNHPLKIIIAVHHFPPHFKGGAEWRAYRTAQWLQSRGHTVKVICVESITDSLTPDLRWVDEKFDSLAVRRLFLNLANAPDPIKWEYDNSWIEAHLTSYLADEKPDIFHLISGYLMTAGAIKAAKNQHIPLVVTLTDFWFLCHRHTLHRTSGQLCSSSTALDCVRCDLEKKRRFRLPAQKLPALTDALWHKAEWLPVVTKGMAQMENRFSMLRAVLSQVEVAICPSNFLREVYFNKGFSAKSMKFLRQGLMHLPPLPVKKSSSPKLRLGYIGQISPHKGVHVLIEAYAQLVSASHGRSNEALQRTQLKLYGDVSQFSDFYETLRRQIKGDVQFRGPFDHKQLNRVYEEIDVLIVPSIWYENSPNVILEAFAYQTPVLASRLGGMAELVADQQTGLLFTPDDPADLAEKLKMLLDQPELLAKWQENIVRPADTDTEMEEILQIYTSILAEQDRSVSCIREDRI